VIFRATFRASGKSYAIPENFVPLVRGHMKVDLSWFVNLKLQTISHDGRAVDNFRVTDPSRWPQPFSVKSKAPLRTKWILSDQFFLYF
jgi:hypothetical protein